MPAILFVCTANQFRSPIAAACLTGTLSPVQLTYGWQIASAGTWAPDGKPALHLARQIAQQLGLQGLELHRTRMISYNLLKKYDLILVMEANHKEALCSEFQDICSRVFMLSEVIDGFAYDFPDPLITGDDPLEVATELCSKITSGAKKILNLAESLNNAKV